MKAHRLFVVATAIVMLTSGLGILATAGIHRETTSEQAPGNSPMLGAIRTVFAEDFTNSACGPCSSHNPDWTAAIRAKGYSKVAPAFTHVHWPTDTDPINMYSQMNTWANYRRSMHLISSVPSAWMDGENVNTHQGQAAYEALIDEYGTVLSPLKITTTGNIDGGTRNGTLNIHVEAVNDIPADQNLRLMTYIWEDAINVTARFGSFPNGETVADWAVWLMLDGDSDEMNNHVGELIWSTGATAGDTIDVVRNFQCNSTWELAEMGATVFVQNFNTLEVLNSAVDQFDGGVTPPAHDLEVRGLDVPTLDVAASTTVPVRAVIYNNGATDETNLEVEFTVGGILQDTKYVTSLPAGLGEYVDFDWNTPAVANSYVLGFEVIAVPGESNLTNNEWSTTVQVTYQPEIWTSPGGMDFSVISNWNDSDNITIGNTGTGDCNFNITIGVDIEEFGGFSSVF
ncbi:MAG: hypothetical protein KAS23_16390, partial [Anaerohalosphaera sp.]|nr:hypothetical protein [Anaerohalosphaera sp.]